MRYAPAVENIQLEQIYRHQTSVWSLNGLPHPTDGNSRKNRMELRAACILVLTIFPFCAINLILTVCALSSDLDSPELIDPSLMMTMLICRELIRLHFVYIPIVFATQSREFRAAVKRFCRTKTVLTSDELN